MSHEPRGAMMMPCTQLRLLVLTLVGLTLAACLALPTKQEGAATDSGSADAVGDPDQELDLQDEDGATADGLADPSPEIAGPETQGDTTTPEDAESLDADDDAGVDGESDTDGICPAQSCEPSEHPDIEVGPCQALGWDPALCACAAIPAGNGGACDDGVACTTGDACQADGSCRGTSSDELCEDGNPCTATSCSVVDGCQTEELDIPCDDDNSCTINDSCVDGACVGSFNPDCECEEATDECELEYGDDDKCNGVLHCVQGHCELDPWSIVSCDTSADPQCKKSVCQPESGLCKLKATIEGGFCDDGDPCTVTDYCSGDGACIPGAPRYCNDGDPCTTGSCDSSTGACIYTLTPNGGQELCNQLDDDCDGETDEADPGICFEGELCIEGSCHPVCEAFDDCDGDEICAVGSFVGYGECVSRCLLYCPAGYGYQLHDGCNCPVPPTGYTQCRDKDNALVDCSTILPGNTGYGQDGHFSKGALSFQDLGNGSAMDMRTGVTWAKPVSDSWLTHAEAVAWCEENPGGLPGSGWAMPSVYAMYGMLDFGVSTVPLRDAAIFGAGGGDRWTSTPAGIGGGTPYMYVQFSLGEVVLNASENHATTRCAQIGDDLEVPDRYVEAIDDTIVDRLTGLRWSATLDCLECDWTEALTACLDKGEGWRLPNAKELLSIVDYTRPTCPRWDPVLGVCPLEEELWSSTPILAALPYAAAVDIAAGYMQRKDIQGDKGGRCVMSLGQED